MMKQNSPKQISQAAQYERMMQSMSANMGMRIVIGYILCAVLVALSLFMAFDFRQNGNEESFWGYLVLAGFGVVYLILVTINLVRTAKKAKNDHGMR